jgi:hypothetical protein
MGTVLSSDERMSLEEPLLQYTLSPATQTVPLKRPLGRSRLVRALRKGQRLWLRPALEDAESVRGVAGDVAVQVLRVSGVKIWIVCKWCYGLREVESYS